MEILDLLPLAEMLPITDALKSAKAWVTNGITKGVNSAVGWVTDLFESGSPRERSTPLNAPLPVSNLAKFQIGGSKSEKKERGRTKSGKRSLVSSNDQLHTVVTGRDLVTVITTPSTITAGYVLYSTKLSPEEFPQTRTSLMARLFQMYSVSDFVVHFASSKSAMTDGAMHFVFYKDVKDTPVQGATIDYTVVSSIANSSVFKIYENGSCSMNVNKDTKYFTSIDEVNTDPLLTHFGGFAIIAGPGLPTGSEIGSAYMEYRYGFSGGLYDPNIIAKYSSAVSYSYVVTAGSSTNSAKDLFGPTTDPTVLINIDDFYLTGFPVSIVNIDDVYNLQISTSTRLMIQITIPVVSDTDNGFTYMALSGAVTQGTVVWNSNATGGGVSVDILDNYACGTNSSLPVNSLTATLIIDPVNGVVSFNAAANILIQVGTTGSINVSAAYVRVMPYISGYLSPKMLNPKAVIRHLNKAKSKVEVKDRSSRTKSDSLSTNYTLLSSNSSSSTLSSSTVSSKDKSDETNRLQANRLTRDKALTSRS
jgi:hypothetical protein